MNLKDFIVETKYINYKKIFLLSDTHLGIRANSLEWLDNIKKFFTNFYIPYLKRNVQDGDILFFLGDFFDNRQLIDINVLNAGIDIILEISKILPVYFITGNHDIYKKNTTDVNSIVAFKYIPNVTIFEKPVLITNNSSKILVIPWIGNAETEELFVRANKCDYVFTHTDINGFMYDTGKEVKNTSIDFTKFKSIKRIFSGHIHKRQEQNNVIYIGSPYHTKRGDIGNTKALYLFDPSNNTYEVTLNDYSPIYQRVYLQSLLELSLNDTIKLLNNNYTDIIVPDKYIQIFNLTKFIDILNNCNYKRIETVAERKKIEEDIINISEGDDIKDILTLLEKSINDLGYKSETLEKLKIINRNYYEKASKEDLE